MGFTFFPILNGAALKAGGDTDPLAEPGVIQAYKYSDGQWCLAQYIQLGAATVDSGMCLVPNDATLKQWSVKKAGTGNRGGPLAGIALATIASAKYGWMAIQGYVGSALLSNTTASNDNLIIGASASAQLSNAAATDFFTASSPFVDSSGFVIVAKAKDAVASGAYSSIQLCGCWGV
jgi:hypothetical protein